MVEMSGERLSEKMRDRSERYEESECVREIEREKYKRDRESVIDGNKVAEVLKGVYLYVSCQGILEL